MAEALLAPDLKVCTSCGEAKTVNAFSCDASKLDGLQTRCKKCRSEKDRTYYAANRDRLKDRVRSYYRDNRETRSAKNQEWAAKNAGRMAEYRREWRRRNRAAEREAAKAKDRERAKCPHYRLNRAVSRSVWGALAKRKGGRRWEKIVGYSVEALIEHLERQFSPGMNWENYGDWHVDHIIPVSRFDFEGGGMDEVRRCWSLPNLRPLWATENHRKHARLVLLL